MNEENKPLEDQHVSREPAVTGNHVLVPEKDLSMYRLQSKVLLVLAGAIAGYLIRGAAGGGAATPAYQDSPPAVANAPQGAQPPQQAGPPQPNAVDPKLALKKLESEALVSVIGNKNAKSVIHEFTDFQCPACKSAAENMLPTLKDKYIKTGKAKLVLVHWPLTAIHPSAPISAKAAICADKQGKLESFHDLLFREQQQWGSLDRSEVAQAKVRQNLIDMAGREGMNAGTFTKCIDSKEFDAGLARNGQLAFELGAQGTPTFFFNGHKNPQSQAEAEGYLESGR